MSIADEFGQLHHLPPNPYNAHAWLVGEPEIGDDVWIGAFAVIDASGGLTIGHGCDISAGVQIYSHSTVAPARSLLVGVPARVIHGKGRRSAA
jgi:acetyltransferase-like isoleucine patch superfamily enzyme